MTCDPDRGLLRITLSGFFTVDDVAAYEAARVLHVSRLRCPIGQHLTLADVTGLDIQTQDVVAAFTRVVGDPRYRPRRLAVVVPHTLTRIQAMRAVDGPGVRVFRSVAEAEDWLLSDPEAETAA
ncbi:hypothetical protein GCM10011380_23190 [Sphingomonas metalli]|uniref:STAS/SEC14 domain-containing protein n=1 Tax=Sphingomonas metalli TaxID=1779358 RepID=A0A916WVE0_9SPHN|nr:hypothetical protein [Sphingomonas metalli]GGB33092.1 hypothetical protein GCM10011380_23190 [Sphingomonas metalli]